jgi:hypothetical protein
MRRLMTKILAIAGAAALAIAIGLLVPLAWMTDGTEEMPGQAQPLARHALLSARVGCLDHPFSASTILRLRIESIEVREGCRGRVFPEFTGHLVRLSGRTLFGLPIMNITICGDETSCRGRADGQLSELLEGSLICSAFHAAD